MISNDLLKAAILEKIKSIAGLIAVLPDGASSIKEADWKGTDFTYPCIRIMIESQNDIAGSTCNASEASFSVYTFSEKASSKEADQIAGIIVSAIRGISFEENNIKFSQINIVENIPAISQDGRTWRAQIRCQSTVV